MEPLKIVVICVIVLDILVLFLTLGFVLYNYKNYRKSVKTMRENRENSKPTLTPKGIAVLAAIEAGLLPRIDGGWDDTKFNKFWEQYEAEFNKNFIIVRKE